MPKIFITNYAGHDYKGAEKFGDQFIFLTKGYVSFQSLDRVKFQIAAATEKFNAEDYLLLSGTLLISVLAVLIIYARFDSVNLLVYDAKDNKYREMKLTKKNFETLFSALTEQNA